eukprot:TRINITY_DN721_c0_g1_i2.p1 TRINITY_DN721_c0_g1~~TRINITY_DN721_c0_g1_i2.p1  ORF type:complete len:343 (+),score=150.41 TRINITY_DN721_c0_g1_i2:131-1030(+)
MPAEDAKEEEKEETAAAADAAMPAEDAKEEEKEETAAAADAAMPAEDAKEEGKEETVAAAAASAAGFGEVVDDAEEDNADAESADSLDEVIETLKQRAEDREADLKKLRRYVWNKDPEKRSIYVGQVDLSTLPEELYFGIFRDCGAIENVSIQTDQEMLPVGYAYIRFKDVLAAELALMKHGLNWRGLKLEVCMKATSQGAPPPFRRLDSYQLQRDIAMRGGGGGFAGRPLGGGPRRGGRGGMGMGMGMPPPPPPSGPPGFNLGGAPIGGGGGGGGGGGMGGYGGKGGGRRGSDRYRPY